MPSENRKAAYFGRQCLVKHKSWGEVVGKGQRQTEKLEYTVNPKILSLHASCVIKNQKNKTCLGLHKTSFRTILWAC